MSNQGYAIVDVDDDVTTGQRLVGQGSGLEFQTFLSTPSPNTARNAPDVPYSPFNIAYYQTYFDVDTMTVLRRVGMAMIPREGFVLEVCDGQVDMYGPFWTLTTLVLILYITSTLTSSITQYLASPDSPIASNLPLLSTAISTVYIYGLLVPAGLWSATKWLGVAEWSIFEAFGLYGYAMSVYIPIGLLCLVPVGIFRWVLVAMGASSSGYFLVRNIYPVLASDKMARMLIIAVVVLHGAMALALKVLFFSYTVAGVQVGPDPIDDPMS